MTKLYLDIFKRASSCRREGKNGTSIDAAEFSRQLNELTNCAIHINTNIKINLFIDNEPKTDKETRAFAHVLSQHAVKYNIFDRFVASNALNALVAYIERGQYLLRKSEILKASLESPNDVTKKDDRYDILDLLREFCFVFCLVSVDVYAPSSSIESAVNIAVIYDELKDSESLEMACQRIEEYNRFYTIEDVDLLWECGILNYKICKYRKAISYFKKYIDVYITQNKVNEKSKDVKGDILDAYYKIAYCYEFTYDISIALYMFAKIFLSNDFDAYTSFGIVDLDNIIKWMPKNKNTSATKLWIDRVSQLCLVPASIDDKNNTELIHGIAHLINELVIFYPKKPNAPETLRTNKRKDLLRFANRLMYAAACRKDVFFTCLGTNHSENSEFEDAINIFEFLLYGKPGGIFDEKDRIHLRMEVVFYLAHACLYSGRYDKANEYLEEFAKYCELLNDREGFAHLAIYNVYLLLNKSKEHFKASQKEFNDSLNLSEIKTAISLLEKNIPSKYTTQIVQTESKRLRSFLGFILTLQEMFNGNIISDLAIKCAKSYMSKCADNEYFAKRLNYSIKEQDGHQVTRIENGKYSDDVIYIVDGDIPLDNKFFVKKNSDIDWQLGDPGELNDSNVQAVPIIILTSINEDDIEWAIRKASTKPATWYMTNTTGVKFKKINQSADIIIIQNYSIYKIFWLAYLQYTYTLVNRSFSYPRVFLGLAPTRMTQIYKFNVRKKEDLYEIKKPIANNAIGSYLKKMIKITQVANNRIDHNLDLGKNLYIFDVIDNLVHTSSDFIDSKILATVFIPQIYNPNCNWHYKFKNGLLIPGYKTIRAGNNDIIDKENLPTFFSEKLFHKNAYQPHRDKVQDFLQSNIKRSNDCIRCPWNMNYNCAHTLYQTIDTIERDFLNDLFSSLSFFDTNLDLAKSILLVQLDQDVYFIVVLNDIIDEGKTNISSRKIVNKYIDLLIENRPIPQKTTDTINLSKNSSNIKVADKPKRFKVALSFASEYRDFIDKLAKKLMAEYGDEYIFYDHSEVLQSELLVPSLRKNWAKYYKNTKLAVVFHCQEYNDKKDLWCGDEWEVLKPIIESSDENVKSTLMMFTFDGVIASGASVTNDGISRIDAKNNDQIDFVYNLIKIRVKDLEKSKSTEKEVKNDGQAT